MSSIYERYLKAMINAFEQEAKEHPERTFELLGRKSLGNIESSAPAEIQPESATQAQPTIDASSKNGDMDKMDFILSQSELEI